MRGMAVLAAIVAVGAGCCVVGCSEDNHEAKAERDKEAYLQRRLEAVEVELDALEQRLLEVPTEKQRGEILDRLEVLRAQYDELRIQLPEEARPPVRKQLREVCPEDDPLCNSVP